MDLKRQLDDEWPDVVMMKYAVGYDGDGAPSFFFYRERLLRRCGKAVWKGRIHEAVEPFGKVVREDIMIEHRKVGTGDPDRNLRIFEQMLRENGKLSPRDQYYYGKELYYHRRYRDAASVFRNIWNCRMAGGKTGWMPAGMERTVCIGSETGTGH